MFRHLHLIIVDSKLACGERHCDRMCGCPCEDDGKAAVSRLDFRKALEALIAGIRDEPAIPAP